jgi:oligopeptide/dipeptide ABC transporter ATP-binding protein
MTLLSVEDLRISLREDPDHPLVRDLSFEVAPAEVVGLVGESGSGKTLTSLAVAGLLPRVMEVGAQRMDLDGASLLGRRKAGSVDVSMIFQNPRAALNPTMRIGRQVARAVAINQGASRGEARAEATRMLERVGIPGAERIARAYPHQLSGGMCQRVVIAMALACRPKLLIADEPTTGLDVTIQAQIFDLLLDLVQETGCGVLFITHDLAAVAEMCDRVEVLYGGQRMESAPVLELFERPHNPYTRYLLDSVDMDVDPWSDDPGVDFHLAGCRFAHRCPAVHDRCEAVPPAYPVGDDHRSACFLAEEDHVGTA